MAKPVRHRDKWRIRWLDHTGQRCSEVYEKYHEAQHMLRRRQVEAAQIKRGLKPSPPEEKLFGELCDYWLEYCAPRGRPAKER